MKQPPIKTKELYGSTVQIADGQNWEIASITAYGENAQGGTTEAPVALTGVDSVQVCGNNLLPMATEAKTIYGVTFTPNSDGSVTIKGTATGWSSMVIDGDFSLPAGTYTLNSNTQTTGVGLSISKDVGGTQNIATSSTTSKTFTLPDLIKHYVAYIVVRPNLVVDTTIYPMLNLGSTAMPYEPYQGSVTTLPIPRPLRRVGDVKDKCVTRVKSECDKKIVFDGSADEAWSKNVVSGIGTIWRINQSDAVYRQTPLSNIYPSVANETLRREGVIYIQPVSQVNVIDIVDSSIDTIENWRAKLSSTPLTVYYQSTAYDGTNGLDICLTEYQTGFVELDGTEAWNWNSSGAWAYISTFLLNNKTGIAPACSHYQGTGAVMPAANQVAINEAGSLIIKDPSWKSVADAKAYLAAQKAAGTPVQVAYQLATPEVYATDPVDFDNAAGPLTIMTGGELEVTLTHRMLTPYTAWAIRYDSEGEYTGDFFNVEDYDRIKQNIEYLREYAYFLYGGFTMRGMVAVTVESYGYASTIDALDANLEAIAANTFRPPDMMPVKQWRGNQPPPGADDWNRIENTCLLLFEQFERQFACLPKLAFELKGSAF